MKKEAVEQPSHYNTRGFPAADVIEHFGCCVANALKYLWRAGEKNDLIEDLEKGRWYVRREVQRLRQGGEPMPTAAKMPQQLHTLSKQVDCSDGSVGFLLRRALDTAVDHPGDIDLLEGLVRDITQVIHHEAAVRERAAHSEVL